MLNDEAGLVLEGGGMRGVFTSGVLDYFMDYNIYFPYTIGVSAGACNALSYASRQRGRSKYSNITLMGEYKYIGIKRWLFHRSMIDFDLLFNKFPTEIIPYDYDTYFNAKERYVLVTTNCLTGKAEYWEEKRSTHRLLAICRASCTLPVVCPVAYVDGVPMLDGGVSDPIPVRRAIGEGFRKNVVVLTRNKGYRKKEKEVKLPWFIYPKYPAIRQQLKIRTRQYNETLDFIEEQEEMGNVIVIRPEQPVQVDRMEKNVEKLSELYYHGYECARNVVKSLF